MVFFLFFSVECKRKSSNPEVLHSLYTSLWGNDCFLICHSSHPHRSKADFQVRHFSFGSIRSHWKGESQNYSKNMCMWLLCKWVLTYVWNGEMFESLFTTRTQVGSWLGCASEVIFCQGDVQGVFISCSLFLEVKYMPVHRKIGSCSIRFCKNKGRKKADFVKGHGSATARLWVPGQHGLSWELVLSNNDNVSWNWPGV